jgi:predicted small lipoprotein YifL
MIVFAAFRRHEPSRRVKRAGRAGVAAACAAVLSLAGCGGGNPLSNPPEVSNPPGTTGQTLSYAYFQKCINPILLARLQINMNGVLSVNTCAASGCHDNTTGTGGAFRVVGAAQPLDVTAAANTPAVIRASDMYKNFYSAQGEVVFGSLTQSRILAKPRLLNVLHGGGLIFENDQDPNVKLIQYWINHPVPQGQDEFSSAANSMFTPPDPNTGACNTQ